MNQATDDVGAKDPFQSLAEDQREAAETDGHDRPETLHDPSRDVATTEGLNNVTDARGVPEELQDVVEEGDSKTSQDGGDAQQQTIDDRPPGVLQCAYNVACLESPDDIRQLEQHRDDGTSNRNLAKHPPGSASKHSAKPTPASSCHGRHIVQTKGPALPSGRTGQTGTNARQGPASHLNSATGQIRNLTADSGQGTASQTNRSGSYARKQGSSSTKNRATHRSKHRGTHGDASHGGTTTDSRRQIGGLRDVVDDPVPEPRGQTTDRVTGGGEDLAHRRHHGSLARCHVRGFDAIGSKAQCQTNGVEDLLAHGTPVDGVCPGHDPVGEIGKPQHRLLKPDFHLLEKRPDGVPVLVDQIGATGQ